MFKFIFYVLKRWPLVDFALKIDNYYSYSLAKLLLVLSLIVVPGELTWLEPAFLELSLPHICIPLSLEYCLYSFKFFLLFC